MEPWIRVAVWVERRGERTPRVVRLPHLRLVVEGAVLVEAGIDEHLTVAEYNVGRVPPSAPHRGGAGPRAGVPIVEVRVGLASAVGSEMTTRYEQPAVVNECVATTEHVGGAVESFAGDGTCGWVPDVAARKAVDIIVASGVLLAREEKHLPVR